MEKTQSSWEEHRPPMESPPSKSRNRWWAVGKNLAIAGAALASAPVLVPPLLIFSAVGLSLSLPFGIYFAVLACTDKLMSSLFPSPRGEEKEEDVDDQEEEEEEEEHRSDEKKGGGGEEEEDVGERLTTVEKKVAEKEKEKEKERVVEVPIEEAKSTTEKKGKGKKTKK